VEIPSINQNQQNTSVVVKKKSRLPFGFYLFFRNKGAAIGLVIMIFWVFIAIFAEQVAPYDPLDKVGKSRQPPSSENWFGTDKLGRDVFSRVLYGGRISLSLGLISVFMGSIIGTSLGLISGYSGGSTDSVIMRMMDAMLAFPGMLLALVVIAALGPSIRNVMIAVGISTLPIYARLVRGMVLSIKESPYIDAARIVGASSYHIMSRHILPNSLSPIIVLSTLQVGSAILVGSGLSFLGLGAQPPTPEWGLMAADGREALGKAWWISTFAGLAILSVVMATNLIGDGLRAGLDPRLKID